MQQVTSCSKLVTYCNFIEIDRLCIYMYAYDIIAQHHVCINAPSFLILLYSNSNVARCDVKA
jgi:hypothetical protein